jgi:hypothetical protein
MDHFTTSLNCWHARPGRPGLCEGTRCCLLVSCREHGATPGVVFVSAPRNQRRMQFNHNVNVISSCYTAQLCRNSPAVCPNAMLQSFAKDCANVYMDTIPASAAPADDVPTAAAAVTESTARLRPRRGQSAPPETRAAQSRSGRRASLPLRLRDSQVYDGGDDDGDGDYGEDDDDDENDRFLNRCMATAGIGNPLNGGDGDDDDDDAATEAHVATEPAAAAVVAAAAGVGEAAGEDAAAAAVRALLQARAKTASNVWNKPMEKDILPPDSPLLQDPDVRKWPFAVSSYVTQVGKRASQAAFFQLFFDVDMAERMRTCTSTELVRRRDLQRAAIRAAAEGGNGGANGAEPVLTAAEKQKVVDCDRIYAPLKKSELYTFLAMTVAMSIHHLPELRMYWNRPQTSCIGGARFSEWMTRDRFIAIKASMRFSSQEDQPTVGVHDSSFDRLWKMRKMLDSLNSNLKVCSACYCHAWKRSRAHTSSCAAMPADCAEVLLRMRCCGGRRNDGGLRRSCSIQSADA